MRRSIFGSPPVASTRTLDGLVEPHGRRLLAFRRTRLAQRLIACNAADPYPLGDEPDPPKGGPFRGGSAGEHSLPSSPDRVRRRRGRLHLPHGPRGAGRNLRHGRRAGRVAVALPDGHDNVCYAGAHDPPGLRKATPSQTGPRNQHVGPRALGASTPGTARRTGALARLDRVVLSGHQALSDTTAINHD
jgi:hypothetical protein